MAIDKKTREEYIKIDTDSNKEEKKERNRLMFNTYSFC